MKVKNRRCIRTLSFRQLKASKSRNLIAVFAIALTTLLFTSLFTIALSINDGFQQSNFRQCGGWNHGSFKYLTEEQFDQIKTDPLIQEWGLRRFVGMPDDIPFNKSHVEVGYSDATQAHWMYCDPIEGALPQEGTNQAATDTRVLELLGVEPELGAQFTVTFPVDGHTTTQTFTLCGWWEYDEAVVANHILIPLSRAQQIYDEVGLIPGQAKDGMTGSWNLDVMFKNSLNIDQNMKQVLANFGYQDESPADGDNYIRTGVNWGYSASQLAENIDPGTILAIAAMLLLIVFTGYLIIYNVFQISVANDIRFYGLLKTIGTTPSQISRMIRLQALLLSLLGIPLGLVGGWFVGGALTPVIISRLDGIVSLVSLNPAIFIVSSLFSLFTVLLSCYRPGKIAAKVSPVEAVRYTEGSNIKRKKKRSVKNLSLFSMAKSNLGRNRTKTVVTVLSLSLAVVLLNLTVTFTNGFDMDKYLANFVTSDFVLADARYFQTGALFGGDTLLPESVIDEVEAQGGITEGGRVYGRTFPSQEFITEDYYRTLHGMWMSREEMDRAIKFEEKNQEGLIAEDAQLYGMEPFALDRLRPCSRATSRRCTPTAAARLPLSTPMMITANHTPTPTGQRWATPSPSAMWRNGNTIIRSPERFSPRGPIWIRSPAMPPAPNAGGMSITPSVRWSVFLLPFPTATTVQMNLSSMPRPSAPTRAPIRSCSTPLIPPTRQTPRWKASLPTTPKIKTRSSTMKARRPTLHSLKASARCS